MIWIDLILEVVALGGLLLVVAGLLGRVDRSRPRCRACGCDLRGVARAMPPGDMSPGPDAPGPDTSGPVTPESIPCPNCGKDVHRRRGIRWRPFRVRRWALALGCVVLMASAAGRLFGIHLARQGLFWHDLLSATPIIERVTSTPPTASMDDWLDLGRRVRAQRLTTDELERILAALEDAPGALGLGGTEGLARSGSAVAQRPQANAYQIGAFLESALVVEASQDRRTRLWSLLSPLPAPTVTASSIPGSGATNVFIALPGTSRASFGWPRGATRDQRPLLGLRFIGAVRLDGSAVEVQSRSIAPDGESAWALSSRADHLLGVAFQIDAEPGTHEIELDVASAPVDADLCAALCNPYGQPGPPQRWGARTHITVTTLRVLLRLPPPDEVDEQDEVGSSEDEARPTARPVGGRP